MNKSEERERKRDEFFFKLNYSYNQTRRIGMNSRMINCTMIFIHLTPYSLHMYVHTHVIPQSENLYMYT